MLVTLLSACFAPPPIPTDPPAPEPARRARRAPLPPAVIPREGRRVVAMGDLHGDRDATLAALRLGGLVDEAGTWTGGDTILVQTGDTTDRGPDSLGVITLLRSLVEPARAAGGEVVMVNGNHEVMNLMGDWRYVSEADVAGFGGVGARREAFSRDGEVGRFLRSLPVVAMVDDTVFVHGGLTSSFAGLGVDALNTTARLHYDDALEDRHPVHDENGPTWYRGYVTDPPEQACPHLERALAAVGGRRMVVGHTTQRTGDVLTRCDGRLAVIDVGISAHYGGHVGVWEWVGDDARFLTPAGPVDLVDPG